jgi:hypothetical protein
MAAGPTKATGGRAIRPILRIIILWDHCSSQLRDSSLQVGSPVRPAPSGLCSVIILLIYRHPPWAMGNCERNSEVVSLGQNKMRKEESVIALSDRYLVRSLDVFYLNKAGI